MSTNKKSKLDQYGTESFEQQQCWTSGVKGVITNEMLHKNDSIAQLQQHHVIC